MADDRSSWLTTVLRPAGRPDTEQGEHVLSVLRAATAGAGALLVDLRAAERLPAGFTDELVRVDGLVARHGGILLVMDPDGRHALPDGLLRDAGALALAGPPPEGAW